MAQTIGSLVIEMSANVARLQQDMREMRAHVETATGDMSRSASSAASTLSTIGSAISVTAVVYSIKEIGTALIDAQAQTDKFRAAMTAIGNTDAAEAMGFVRETARTLGLDLDGAAAGFVKLSAAARGTTLEGQATRDIFTAVSQAATTLGLSTDETNGALLAISQMMSKGTVQSEELRGQLGERLPGAFQIAARAMGVSTAELGKMLEAGQVISDDFLPKFAAQLKKELGEASVEAAQSASRELVRLKNSWGELVQAVADSGTAGVLGKVLGEMAGYWASVAEQIRLAKKEGAGFFGQMWAGLAAGNAPLDTRLDELEAEINRASIDETGPINAANYRAQLQDEIDRVRQQIAARDEQFALPTIQITNETNALEALKKKYGELATDLSGQHKSFQASLTTLNAAREKGIVDEETYVAMVQKLIKEQGGVKDALAERTKAEKEAKEHSDKLNATYLEAVGVNKDYSEKVGLLVELYKSGKLTQDEYTDSIKKLGEAQPVVRGYTEDRTKAEKELAEIFKKQTAQEIERLKTLDTANTQLDKQIEQERSRTERLGLTGVALVELMNKEADREILRVQELANAAAINGAEQTLLDAYQAQIDKLKELKQAKAEGVDAQWEVDQAKAAAEAATKAQEEWKRASDDINKSLTDALLRGFESGRGFGENLVSTLKNMFQTLVLRPVISAVMNPISQGISSMMGSYGLGPMSGMGGSMFGSGMGSLGLPSMGNLFAGGIGSAGTNIAMSGFGEAMGLSTAAVPEAMIAGELTGMGSLVSGLGAAMPYLAAAVALYSIFSSPGGGPKSGGQSILDFAGGAVDTSALQSMSAGDGGRMLYTPNSQDAKLYGLSSAAIGQIRALASAFGGSAGDLTLGLGFDTDPEGTASNRVSSFLGRNGSLAYSAMNLDFGRDADALEQGLADEVSKVVVAGLATSGLSGKIGEYFSALNLTEITGDQARAAIEAATSAQAMADAVRDLGGIFGTFSDLTVEARGNIVALTGGLDAFNTKTAGFVQNYFSEEEQAGITAARVLRSLGASGVDFGSLTGKSDVRSYLDTLDVTGTEGQAQFAAVLNASAAIAQIAPFLEGAGLNLAGAAALAPGGGAYDVLTGSADSAAQTAEATAAMADSMAALISQNGAAYATMISTLASIDSRLASIETGGDLAAAAPPPVVQLQG